MSSYYESCKPREVKDLEQRRRRKKYVFAGFVVLVIEQQHIYIENNLLYYI